MRGLALGGGAARGAWQAGRLSALRRQWEIVAGVSVGAVNAAHLAQYEVGDEDQALEDLRDLWHGLKTRDVHRRWFPLGMVHGLWRSGVRDLRPLRRFLHRHLEPWRIRDSGRQLVIGAVSFSGRRWLEWTEADHAVIIDAVVASCAIPYAFEPQPSKQLAEDGEILPGPLCVDGGVRTVVPVESLTSRGATQVDAIVCFPASPHPADPPGSALSAGLESVDTMNLQIIEDDLKHVPEGVDLEVFRPDRDLGDGLDFSPDQTAWRWKLGEEGSG